MKRYQQDRVKATAELLTLLVQVLHSSCRLLREAVHACMHEQCLGLLR